MIHKCVHTNLPRKEKDVRGSNTPNYEICPNFLIRNKIGFRNSTKLQQLLYIFLKQTPNNYKYLVGVKVAVWCGQSAM